MNSRGARTQRRADERREQKATELAEIEERRKKLDLQLSYRPKKGKKT